MQQPDTTALGTLLKEMVAKRGLLYADLVLETARLAALLFAHAPKDEASQQFAAVCASMCLYTHTNPIEFMDDHLAVLRYAHNAVRDAEVKS